MVATVPVQFRARCSSSMRHRCSTRSLGLCAGAEMEVAVRAGFPAEGDVDVDAGHGGKGVECMRTTSNSRYARSNGLLSNSSAQVRKRRTARLHSLYQPPVMKYPPLHRITSMLVCSVLTVGLQAQQLTATISAVDHNGYHVSCFGSKDGEATVTVTGGTPPYTCDWSTGQNTATITELAPTISR